VYPLGRIVRRIKKMVETNEMTLGVGLMAIGITIMLASLPFHGDSFAVELIIAGIVVSISGIFLCSLATFSAWQEKKRLAKKENWEIDGQIIRTDALGDVFSALQVLVSELRGLRQDLKGGEPKNDGSKDN
jgi:hypothetical protein